MIAEYVRKGTVDVVKFDGSNAAEIVAWVEANGGSAVHIERQLTEPALLISGHPEHISIQVWNGGKVNATVGTYVVRDASGFSTVAPDVFPMLFVVYS